MDRRARIVPLPALLIACIVQAIRVTHGVDFNDEMGYYGELVGIAAGGRLFANELFIQQGVYVLLLPLAKPYVALFGWSWLIVAVRIVFALFILWVYRRVRLSLESAAVPAAAAAIAALACTFVVPFANIYSPSYNSVGLGLLAVAFGEFYEWRGQDQPVRSRFWAVLVTVLFIVHPPLAAGVAIVVSARLWFDRDLPAFKQFLVAVCGCAVVAAVVLLPLAPTMQDFRAAVEFSRAMAVGAVFRHGLPWLLAIVFGIVVVFTGTHRRAPVLISRSAARWHVLALVTTAGACAVITLMESVRLMWPAAFIAVLVAVAMTAWPEPEERHRRFWMTALLLGTGGAMALTSSNGFRQLQGPAMLAAPLYFALAVSSRPTGVLTRTRHATGWTFGLGLLAAFTAYWLANPYHDRGLIHQTARVDEAPAFRGLRLTPEKAAAVRDVRAVLSDIPPRSRVLILGGQPWMYFATTTHPDTDMVFMHSLLGSPRAFDILADRLHARQPDFVIITGDMPDPVRRAFDQLVRNESFTCDARPAGEALDRAQEQLQMFYSIVPVMEVCRRVAASS
jgi:hypothetical protein